MTDSIEWQPIETAPKDGTLVLIAGGLMIRDRMRSVRLDDDSKAMRVFEGVALASYCDVWIDGRFPWASFMHSPSLNEGDRISHEPTHYATLPPPPEQKP